MGTFVVNGGSSDAILASVTVDSMDNVYAAAVSVGQGGRFWKQPYGHWNEGRRSPGWSALFVKYQ